MASDSFQIMGMADQGQLPKVLAKRSVYGTPTIPVLLSGVLSAESQPLNETDGLAWNKPGLGGATRQQPNESQFAVVYSLRALVSTPSPVS